MALARMLEPFAVQAADFVIGVSDGYVKSLSAQYKGLQTDQFTVIPFPAASSDFEVLSEFKSESISGSTNGKRHIVYVGRGGPDMTPILEVFFSTLAELRAGDAQRWNKLQFDFVGTNYSPKDRTFDLIQPTAQECQVADLTREVSERIPYFDALKLLRDSSAILLIGSTASEYTSSKLFTCLLSGRPVLALLNNQSLARTLISSFNDVFVAGFDANPGEENFRAKVRAGLKWLEQESRDNTLRPRTLGEYSARELTRQICEIFDRVAVRQTTRLY